MFDKVILTNSTSYQDKKSHHPDKNVFSIAQIHSLGGRWLPSPRKKYDHRIDFTFVFLPHGAGLTILICLFFEKVWLTLSFAFFLLLGLSSKAQH